MPISPISPFWPSVEVVGEIAAGACNYPEHWVAADITFTVEVAREDGSGLKERRFQCPTCGRVYIKDVVTA